MSQEKNYIVGWFPDEQSEQEGIKRVATLLIAKDEEHAKAKAQFTFLEEYSEAQSAAYKMLICEDGQHISSRPARGVWDTDYLYKNDWSEKNGYPEPCDSTPIDVDTLPARKKVAILVKYDSTNVTKADLPAAYALFQDEDEAATFEGHVVEAICRTPEIANMYSTHIQRAIAWVAAKCDPTAKWPVIQVELKEWHKQESQQNKTAAQSKSIVDIAREKSALEKINSVTVNAAVNAPERPKRSYAHTYQTLDQEIAIALWPGDVFPGNVPGEIHRWAKKEVMEAEREDWKRFSMALRTTENILKYDALTIRDLVQMRPEDIHKDPVRLNDYINDYLAKNGVYENEAEQNKKDATDVLGTATSATRSMESTCDGNGSDAGALETKTQVSEERQGPFYYRSATGDKIGRANKLAKLKEVISQGFVEISQEEYQARKKGTFKHDADQLENTEADDCQSESPVTAHALAKSDDHHMLDESEEVHDTPQEATTDYRAVAESLEKELAEKPDSALDNLKLWRSVMRTDPRFTKQLNGIGFDGTSINAEYMIMRATELFGPIGCGWGYEVLEDRMLPGAPLSEPIYEDKKFIGMRMLRDADGTLLFEQNHSMKIRLWYKNETGECSVYAYGATPYLYKSNKRGIVCDGEAQKKSLTDAIKKGLSLLGFSADIWLGLYDRPEYLEETRTVFALSNTIDKAEDVTRVHRELDEKMTRIANTIEKASTPNEAKKVFDTLAREVKVHREAAEAKGDTERSKYLSSRMRRLSQILDERLKALVEQEQTA